MKVVFRADASPSLGVGHIMRCLSLARFLLTNGSKVRFVSLKIPTKVRKSILDAGCEYREIGEPDIVSSAWPANSDLKVSSTWSDDRQLEDAKRTSKSISDVHWDWIVVDHYSIDSSWERLIDMNTEKLLVIDDLANRSHSCDVLLDQTLGRKKADYKRYVADKTELLVGVSYALLRPEFKELRGYSFKRKSGFLIKNVLICLGGGDEKNVTASVLEVLSEITESQDWNITVVLGAASPWVEAIENLIESLKIKVELVFDRADMAQMMCEADLAIGGAGTSSWERCCLGLPSVMIVMAENQIEIALALEKVGAAIVIPSIADVPLKLPRIISSIYSRTVDIKSISMLGRNIVDGNGCEKVLGVMKEGK